MKQQALRKFDPFSVASVGTAAIVFSFVVSVLALAGHLLGNPFLEGVNPHWTPMKIITAVCFLMLAAALLCLREKAPNRRTLLLVKALGGAVSVTGVLTFANYMVELHTGRPWPAARAPFFDLFLSPSGRMAIITSVLFALYGCILVLLAAGGRRNAGAAHALLIPVSLGSYLVLIGYLFNIPALYYHMNLSIALNTDIAFFCLCIAGFCARPDTWLMDVFTSQGTGGTMARRLLPYLLLLPLIIGWLRLYGERIGLFGSAVGVALVAVAYTICFLSIIWLNARAINRTDIFRRTAEEQLAFQAHLLANVHDAVIGLDKDFVINYWNDSSQKMYGWTAGEAVGKKSFDILHTVYTSGPMEEIVEKIRTDGHTTYEATHRTKDGRTLHVDVHSALTKDPGGQITGYISSCRDVTERKRAEEALREAQTRKATALKNIADTFYSLDGQWRFTEVNPAAEKAPFGRPAAEMLGRVIWDIFPKLVGTVIHRHYLDAAEKHTLEHYESQSPLNGRWYEVFMQGRQGGVDVYMRDVTDRKLAEEALRHSRNLLGEMGRIAKIGAWELDTATMKQEWSDETYAVHDRERGSYDPNSSEEISRFLSGSKEIMEKAFGEALGQGKPYDLEVEMTTVKGNRKWVRAACVPLIEDGKVAKLRGTVQDITERKRTELELKAAHDELESRVADRTAELKETLRLLSAERQRFRDVLDQIPAYVILLTPDYHVAFDNRFFRERFGEHHGRKCYEYLFGRQEPCETCETYTVLKSGKPHHWDWTGPDKRNYDIHDFPFKDADGSSLIMEVGLDITEQKRLGEELRSASLYSRSLIEASLDPLVTISPEGKITDVNDAAVTATGEPRDRLVGTDFSWYFTKPEEAREGYQQVFEKGFVTDYPLTIRHRDGRLTDVLYNASVYKDIRGNVIGVFAAARDVTGKKAAEAELEKHRLHLEELVKVRTGELEKVNLQLQGEIVMREKVAEDLAMSNKDLEQFAYVASHDLQEPLRAIGGFVELLRGQLGTTLDAKKKEYMDFVVDGVARMQALIHGLLEYSRIETRGREPQSLDSRAALDKALLNLQKSIEESGAKIVAGPLPPVTFDPVQLAQLFQNLIGNAIKFRSATLPEIHIAAVREGKMWRFTVKDNGIGIDPQYASRIFIIFQRLHTRKEYPGTGIGLAICKKIVERHGGRIWVESQAGSGAAFNFTIQDKGE